MYHDEDLYASYVDPVEVRRRIGMVFQKPNPFPKSIYDNVAFGPRLNGFKGDLDGLVEQSLRRAAIWDEVKDKLKQSGLSLSGGQQQRLCIARAIATDPEVILMDEPCSALDPRATLQIEELMAEIKERYTIVIVTHNMQQAARASDKTVFLNMAEDRAGYVVEQGETVEIFTDPEAAADRGLRVRPVRLRQRRHERRPTAKDATMDAQLDDLLHQAAGDERRSRAPRRARRSIARKRSSATRSCAWAPSSRPRSARPAERSSPTTRPSRWTSSRATRSSTRRSAASRASSR